MDLGNFTTLALAFALIGLAASSFLARKEIQKAIGKDVSRSSLLIALLIVAFFVLFSIFFVHPAEQLYFDENIYQGIALNILSHGNAEWCQYGTGFLGSCPVSSIYHDPIGISFFLAIGFALFGVGIKTAFAAQLFVGALSIFLFFVLSSMLFKRKDAAIVSTIVFAQMPELFVWSRTQAVPDLYFLCLSTLSFLAFVIFAKRHNIKTLLPFSFSLVLAAYTRIEGILLVPIFIALYLLYSEEGVGKTIMERSKALVKNIDTNTRLLLVLLMIVLLLVPEIYSIFTQLANPDYGQSFTSQKLFSIANAENNLPTNMKYLLGFDNTTNYYPAMFPPLATLLAVVGVITLIINRRFSGNRFGVLLFALLWFVAYQLFYGFFYAGSALFGVDVRFMLQAIPGISLLAGVGIIGIVDLIYGASAALMRSMRVAIAKNMYVINVYKGTLCLAVTGILIMVPFVTMVPNITILPQNMPQQNVILRAINFFYNNYQSVPTNCLVFTFTPDIWAEFNRSSAQIGYLYSKDASFLNFTNRFTCFVIDYGYWCNVPPYQSTTCQTMKQNYKLAPLAAENDSAQGRTFAFYQIMNYTH